MKKIFLTLSIALAFASCDDYLDVKGDQQNNPYTDNVAPKEMLAGALTGMYRNQAVTLNSYGNKMNYSQGINYGFTTTDEAYNYLYKADSYTALWENTYTAIDRFQNIIDKELSNPTELNHVAIAKIMKVYGMQHIISLYGDAPYSEAFKNDIHNPKYDDDKEIFKSLLLLLDEARANISTASADPAVIHPGAEDVVFRGNMANWEKFTNTLELKLLLKLSTVSNPELVTLRDDRFSALPNNFISADVTVNPGYNKTTLESFNPMYSTWGRNIAGTTTQNYRSTAAGDYFAKLLNGTLNNADITTGIVDPRRSRMFRTSGAVSGTVHGTFPSSARTRVGQWINGDIAATTSISEAVSNGSSRDGYLMLDAESKFLQAEAAQRGFIGGSPQALFNAGVTASFNFYNRIWGTLITATGPAVPNMATTAAAYLTSVDAKNGLGWTGSTDKLNAIMTQKWIALAQINGIEPYLDHVRTGLPVWPLPVGVTEANRPKRLMYPTSEYSSNSANVPSMVRSDLFSINSKSPFYLQ